MKLARWIQVAALLLGIIPAEVVHAQSEQWLEYKVSKEGRGFRWLDMTTNPPANVALPKDLGAKPYFARWTTPMDTNGGRWICFDQAKKNGPYTKLYVDSTGNGRLDDKEVIKPVSGDLFNIRYDGVRFSLKGEDGPIAYHLNIQLYRYDDGPRAYISSAGSYVGKVDFGGVKKRVELIDGNLNGVFNDRLPSTDCDRIFLGEGGDSDGIYLGRYVEVDKVYYQIEAARDGAFVKVKKAENLPIGQIRVPESINTLTVVGENGQFNRKPTNGLVSIPVGKYKVLEWEIIRKDEKGTTWHMAASRPNESGVFKVAADKPTAVDIGEPVLATVTASETKSTRAIAFNLKFEGRNGETVSFTRGSQQPRGPRLVLTNSAGSIAFTNSFEFG